MAVHTTMLPNLMIIIDAMSPPRPTAKAQDGNDPHPQCEYTYTALSNSGPLSPRLGTLHTSLIRGNSPWTSILDMTLMFSRERYVCSGPGVCAVVEGPRVSNFSMTPSRQEVPEKSHPIAATPKVQNMPHENDVYLG